MVIGFLIYLVVMAIVLAFWEVQIEGENGWAANLPCWRKKTGWIVRLSGGRPLTGYHIGMVTFLLLVIHFPFLFVTWTLGKEIFVIGFLLALFLFEDFCWFAINPHYGLRKFKRGEIWWHKNWLGPIPDLYWWLMPLAGVLIYLGQKLW